VRSVRTAVAGWDGWRADRACCIDRLSLKPANIIELPPRNLAQNSVYLILSHMRSRDRNVPAEAERYAATLTTYWRRGSAFQILNRPLVRKVSPLGHVDLTLLCAGLYGAAGPRSTYWLDSRIGLSCQYRSVTLGHPRLLNDPPSHPNTLPPIPAGADDRIRPWPWPDVAGRSPECRLTAKVLDRFGLT
jgi:hypothetical protein